MLYKKAGGIQHKNLVPSVHIHLLPIIQFSSGNSAMHVVVGCFSR